jgi:hypothetical protein
VLGEEPDLALRHHFQPLAGEAFHRHEPLVREHRLDDYAGAPRARHAQLVGLLGGQKILFSQILYHLLPRGEALEPAVFLGRALVHARIQRHDTDRLEAVAPADLVVVEVVARSNLERAGAELRIDMLVSDDRQPATDERQQRRLPDEVEVAVVARAHGDGGVGEHRLGADGRNGDVPLAGLERIVDEVERVVDLAVLHLEV